jgi:hypothetical protein
MALEAEGASATGQVRRMGMMYGCMEVIYIGCFLIDMADRINKWVASQRGDLPSTFP